MTKLKERVVLSSWRIYRVRTKKSDHVVVAVGFRPATDLGHVSSRVLRFYQPEMTLTTWSEELILEGQPGAYSREADRAWVRWCSANNPQSIVDVSSRYCKKVKAA